jgi:hypothetical protein
VRDVTVGENAQAMHAVVQAFIGRQGLTDEHLHPVLPSGTGSFMRLGSARCAMFLWDACSFIRVLERCLSCACCIANAPGVRYTRRTFPADLLWYPWEGVPSP